MRAHIAEKHARGAKPTFGQRHGRQSEPFETSFEVGIGVSDSAHAWWRLSMQIVKLTYYPHHPIFGNAAENHGHARHGSGTPSISA
jgi:hypothetical protein